MAYFQDITGLDDISSRNPSQAVFTRPRNFLGVQMESLAEQYDRHGHCHRGVGSSLGNLGLFPGRQRRLYLAGAVS